MENTTLQVTKWSKESLEGRKTHTLACASKNGSLRAASSRSTPSAWPTLTKWRLMSFPLVHLTGKAEVTPTALVQRGLGNTVQAIQCTPTRLQMMLNQANPQNQPPTCDEILLTRINSKVLGMGKPNGLNTHHYSTFSLLNCLFSWLYPITVRERYTTCTIYLMERNQEDEPTGNPQVASPFTNIVLSSQPRPTKRMKGWLKIKLKNNLRILFFPMSQRILRSKSLLRAMERRDGQGVTSTSYIFLVHFVQ